MSTWKSGRKTITTKCENCGIEFDKTQSEYNRSEKLGRKHFCSIECRIKYNEIRNKNCKQCGMIFIPERNTQKFCSRSCSAKFGNKGRKGEKRKFSEGAIKNIREANNKRLSGIHVNKYSKSPKKCKLCGEIIPYRKRKHVFCDINCKRLYDRRNMSEYQKYYRQCLFDFALNKYPDEFNFSLIEEHGWYSPKNKKNNIGSVSRDHIYSIREGYENNVSPEIIRHPANCQLLIHSENISKHKKSNITLDELNKRISEWNSKH